MVFNWDYDWTEFYYISNCLCSNCHSDKFSKVTGVRCGISRAYYSAFHYAEQYAIINLRYRPPQKGVRKKKNECYNYHQKLIDHYRYYGEPTIQDCGNMLSHLRNMRNLCDYEGNAKKATDDYPNILQEAKNLISQLNGEIHYKS